MAGAVPRRGPPGDGGAQLMLKQPGRNLTQPQAARVVLPAHEA